MRQLHDTAAQGLLELKNVGFQQLIHYAESIIVSLLRSDEAGNPPPSPTAPLLVLSKDFTKNLHTLFTISVPYICQLLYTLNGETGTGILPDQLFILIHIKGLYPF